MNILDLVGRESPLFGADVAAYEAQLSETVRASRFLVIGGAGSIGQAVAREIFKRGPRALHVVDVSENNMVELVRDIRSTLGYIDGDFSTFAIDCGGREFEALMQASGGYDFVFNLSALIRANVKAMVEYQRDFRQGQNHSFNALVRFAF